MATLGTFTTGIARVYDDDRNASQPSFVFNECLELCERPRMQNCTLLTPNRDPGADMSQFFNCDTPASVFSFGNDLLGNYVIGIGCEAILATGKIPEFAACSPCALGLKFGAKSAVSMADTLECVAAIVPTIGVSSDIGNPEVYPEPFIDGLEGWFFHVASNSQIPLSTMVNEIGFSLSGFEQFLLARASHIRNVLTTIQRPDVHCVFAPAQNTIIVGDRAGEREFPFSLLVQLIRIGNLGEHSDGELRAKSELLAGFVIERLLQCEIGEDFDFPCFSTQPIGALVSAIQSREQCQVLIRSRW